VIDEVHERDIDTDLCLFLLKRLIEKNYDKLQMEPNNEDTTLEDDKKNLLTKNRKSSLFCI
jgi:hypothetical protein